MAEDDRTYSDMGHLAYYMRHGLSPTYYHTRDLQAHLQRRESLYRMLGLSPVTIKNSRVLEVAAGTGQNSVFTACCNPSSLTLLEPNPIARQDIANSYDGLEIEHTAPTVVPETLQYFPACNQFDIVICENWLGFLPEDLAMLRKLGDLVLPGGILVITMTPMSGFAANVLRKIMADLVTDRNASFEQNSQILLESFGTHLKTMSGMTRSHISWIQDCMLNPHFLNVALPLDAILNELSHKLTVLSTYPRFLTDWRWFKTLTGDTRRFNESARSEFLRNSANFIDYRYTFSPQNETVGKDLEQVATELHAAAMETEKAMNVGYRDVSALIATAHKFASGVKSFCDGLANGFFEAAALLTTEGLSSEDISRAKAFGSMFGRESVYISFTRNPA